MGVPGCRPIATAVVRGTQVRAAFEHSTRDPGRRLRRVVACIFRPTSRIVGHAAGFLPFRGMARVIPVGGPLPHVADHI